MRLTFAVGVLMTLSVALEARPIKTFFLAPDHFEIETNHSAASLRFAEDQSGITATVALVPAYDVAMHALGYAHRESPDEIQIQTLPVEVTNFSFGGSPILNSPAVNGTDKQIVGNRVVVTIRFSKDITLKQARSYMSFGLVLGTIEARLVETSGVPSRLKGQVLKDIAAMNQYRVGEGGDTGRNAAFSKYQSLNHYKSGILIRQADLISSSRDLDQWVQRSLMENFAAKTQCRANLSQDDDWVCRIILEQSRAGRLSEALFTLATKLFPSDLIGTDLSRFIFDIDGLAVGGPKREAPPPDARTAICEFDRLVASRANPSMGETRYALRVREYLQTLFYTLDSTSLDAATKSLFELRSLEEDTPLTRKLMSLYFLTREKQVNGRQKIKLFLEILVEGRSPESWIEKIFAVRDAGNPGGVDLDASLTAWANHVFSATSERERQQAARDIGRYSTIASNRELTRASLSRLFLDIEVIAGPRQGAAGELTRLIWDKDGVARTDTDARSAIAARLYRLFPELPPAERKRMVEMLMGIRREKSFDAADKRLFSEVLNLLEEVTDESK